MTTNPHQTFIRDTADADVEAIHEPIAREKAEPRDGYEPISIWLVFLFLALAGWGGWYLGAFSGDWNAMVYDERAQAGAAPAAEAKASDMLTLGRRAYVRCQACHQPTGQGLPGTYPPLAGSPYATGPAERAAAIVLNGLQGPLVIDGETFDNIMPAHRDLMTDLEIAAVLTYVRQSWGNDAPAVAPEDVARVRAATAERGAAWTAGELDQFALPEPEPAE